MDHTLASFLAAAALLSGGKNEGAIVPVDDATDALNGARHIPGEVTLARRRGERVVFHPERHVWTMPDGREVGDLPPIPDTSYADCHGYGSEEAREAGRLGALARKAKHDARKAG